MNVNATCHTTGCGNADIPIPIDTGETDPGDAVFICGVCAQPIEDVTEDTTAETDAETGDVAGT